jgi:hypothetical protein
MNETEIKTRQGLILENVLGLALREAGFTFAQDVQYDETCEKPDFLIPNESKPKLMVEVHQTEARNSFQMKTLRAFTAVTESKAHFGNKLVSVNVLFGDPDNELPASNIKAMCGIFDVNIIPRRQSSKPKLIAQLEEFALSLANTEDKKTEAAAKEVAKKHPSAITELASMLKTKISSATARTELNGLWNMERTRADGLAIPPLAGEPTYYKRCMLWALFLGDDDFAELQKKKDPSLCSDSVKKQVVATKLATVTEEMDGDYYTLKPVFSQFLHDPQCLRLRSICKDVLDTVPAMKWFFEDIRDETRRVQMAHAFCKAKSLEALQRLLEKSFAGEMICSISHTRAWVVDCLTRASNISQNKLSRQIFLGGMNRGSLGDPISHIAPRTSRFMALCTTDKKDYITDVIVSMKIVCGIKFIDEQSSDPYEIADRILDLRLDGAIKLRKLDPLYLVAAGICKSLGLNLEKMSVVTIASDLAGQVAVGRFEVFGITPDGRQKAVLLNTVAVHDGHGDDKSKEWGARRLATLYRISEGKVRMSEYQEGIFVIDGEWKDKDVARLYRSGWNHVVRMADLEATLRAVFQITETSRRKSSKPLRIAIDGMDEDLPMAAEATKTPKLKRKGGHG